ncbi:hypothetical protein [Streptomyces otsuchiensis]|uniref:hypothetical protein n=1 Tax=Streptomyces otsuchiensis TaxID=2681388 RepID=UPI00102FDC5D|nr:hypothetical protein [Streptomyces otsuchiensis]
MGIRDITERLRQGLPDDGRGAALRISAFGLALAAVFGAAFAAGGVLDPIGQESRPAGDHQDTEQHTEEHAEQDTERDTEQHTGHGAG